MKTIHTLALTTLAAAMAAGSAFAQQPTSPPPSSPQQTQQHTPQTQQQVPRTGEQQRDHGSKPSYDELNTRGDDRLTRADLAGHPRMLEKFDDIDRAGDGTISRAEYEAWKSKKDGDDGRTQRRGGY